MNLKKLIFCIAIVTAPLGAYSAGVNPELFIKGCYKSYVEAFSRPGKEGERELDKIREKCLSKDFQSKWDSIVSIDGAGMDGLLLSQDSLETWKSELKIQNLNEKTKSAEILLGKDSERNCLHVEYSKVKSDIRIRSVSKCQN